MCTFARVYTKVANFIIIMCFNSAHLLLYDRIVVKVKTVKMYNTFLINLDLF